MRPFFVYILHCSDQSFYTGHTDDIEKRIAEHRSSKFEGYTAQRLPVSLVFLCDFATRDEAFLMERRIKNWSRRKKMALIEGDWNRLSELSKKRF